MSGVNITVFPFPNCSQCANKCVVPSKGEKKLKGKQVEPICCFLRTQLPSGAFENILNGCRDRVEHASKLLYPKLPCPTGQSFRNLRGAWFETLISVIAWNSAIKYNKDHQKEVAIMDLPSASTMQFWELYGGKAKAVLDVLFSSLKNFGITITLPNPDLICVHGVDKDLATNFKQPIGKLIPDEIARIENAYKLLKAKCEYRSIVFGIAVKSALRPDRRYQVIYEGSILKTIVAHLGTRFWDRGLEVRYYGLINEPLSEPDKVVFTNPSIDTIIDVRSEPRKAVDEIIACKTVSETEDTIKKWIGAAV